MGARTSAEIKQRFESKFAKSEDCWEWIGALSAGGYGIFSVRSKIIQAHRFSYELYVDSIPPTLLIRHTCDNRKCVNPEHLLPGTHEDNRNDMLSRRRLPKFFGKTYKLSVDQVIAIRADTRGNQEIATDYNVTPSHISQIKNRKVRLWVPEHISVDDCKKTPPSPELIRETRLIAGLTQTDAAKMIYSTMRTWQDWEAGKNPMHIALFEYFKICVAQK